LKQWEKRLRSLPGFQQLQAKKVHLILREIQEVNSSKLRFCSQILHIKAGNWDITGNNTPIFFIRDPLKFPDFIHTQKRDPRTNLKNPTAVWDFWSLTPESTHQVTILMSDRGTPDGFRHMHGFSSHTFRWVNQNGEAVWVKLHFITQSGIKNLTN